MNRFPRVQGPIILIQEHLFILFAVKTFQNLFEFLLTLRLNYQIPFALLLNSVIFILLSFNILGFELKMFLD